MHRHLAIVGLPAVLALLLTLLGVAAAPAAQAETGAVCTGGQSRAATCLFAAGGSASDQGGGGSNGKTTTGSKMICTYGGAEIPCTSSDGTWSSARGCYIGESKMTEGEPVYDNLMKGHKDGTILACTPPGDTSKAVSYFWAQSAPAAGPDPAVVAQQAIASMRLHMGTLASNPPQSSDTTVMGLVGYPVWLWISDPGESTTGPITREATSGSVTVSATATLSSIVWDMGDGTKVTCLGAGTPWSQAAGQSESPTCGHTYQKTSANQPSEQYPVTATATWDITWTGGGQSGSQTLTFSDTTNLRIGEAQVLLTGKSR